MKEKDARKLILTLLGSAVVLTWWTALSLHVEITIQSLPILSTVINDYNSTTTQKFIEGGSNRPFFVLHVGPPKTATTTIQCGLDAWSLELAQQDSYYFLGKRCPYSNGTMDNGESGIPGHHLMMGLINANPHSRGFEKLKARMEHHLSHGNNIILSIEAMSNHLEDRPETWDLFLSLFRGWNVRIVVAYRHYFDWIRSMYFQQHIGKKYRELWPHQKGLAHPLFHEFLHYHLDRWEKGESSNDGHSWGQHLSLYAIQYFSKHFRDVQVFDLHQQGDVFTNFICQMIPGATNTCHHLRKKASLESNMMKRESHSFDADRLALAAYNEGILHKNIRRTDAVQKVANYLLSTDDLSDRNHLVCLSDGLKARFLNASLWFESEVALSKSKGGDIQTVFHRNVVDHIQSFHKAVDGAKFCEVNTESILMLENWRTFFAKMKPKK